MGVCACVGLCAWVGVRACVCVCIYTRTTCIQVPEKAEEVSGIP